MQHGIEPVLAKNSFKSSAIADIALDQRPPANEIPVTRREIIEYDAFMTRCVQSFCTVAANVASSSRNEDARHSAVTSFGRHG
jgi:hypothetical protein